MTRTLFLVCAIVFATFNVSAAEVPDTEIATSWLELIDAGHYDQSWDQAAALFQGQLGKSQWEQALTQARQPLGAMLTRELTSVKLFSALPGAPDGEYAIVIFTSSFEHKNTATETLTLSKEGEQWAAVGYFIK